jgi:hypothetical protein
MPRYNLYQQVSRVLGSKLGSVKNKAEVWSRPQPDAPVAVPSM